MRTTRPLSLTVRPKAPVVIRQFNADATHALAEVAAVSVTPLDDGLLLEALWEPDLEEGVEHLRKVLGVPLSSSNFRIHYVLENPALEPVLTVVVTCPEEFVGDVIADLSQRRGLITELKDADGQKRVNARVPLSELIGYAVPLRIITKGSGRASATFFDYQPVPPGSDPRGPIANVMRA